MDYLTYFYNRTLKLDLINKFYYTNLKKLPKLDKIVLNSNCKATDLKVLSTHLLALEIITNQRGRLTVSKKPNLMLKIKKGNPTGCKLTIKKSSMLNFLSKNLNEIFPKIKNSKGATVHQKVETGACLFIVKNVITFNELSEHYYLFNHLSNLNLSFITNVKTTKEMLFLLKSLQLPIKSL